jgi:hypothetical protein
MGWVPGIHSLILRPTSTVVSKPNDATGGVISSLDKNLTWKYAHLNPCQAPDNSANQMICRASWVEPKPVATREDVSDLGIDSRVCILWASPKSSEIDWIRVVGILQYHCENSTVCSAVISLWNLLFSKASNQFTSDQVTKQPADSHQSFHLHKLHD